MEGMEENISPSGEIPSTDSTDSYHEAINEIVHDAVQEVAHPEKQQTNRHVSPYEISHETDWAERNQTIRQADWAQRHKAARKAKKVKQQQTLRWQQDNEENKETNGASNTKEATETDSPREEEDHQNIPQPPPRASQSKFKKVTTI